MLFEKACNPWEGIFHDTYLSDEWWEILVFEYNWKDFFGESGLIHDIESATGVCPRKNVLILFTLYSF